MDWQAAGGNVASFLVGAGIFLKPWLQSRKEQKRLEAEKEPWTGAERRSPVTGKEIIRAIEDDTSPVPRHWVTFVDDRIVHKINNALAGPLLELKRAADRMGDDVKMYVKETRDNTSKLDRIIGRLFPHDIEDPVK